MTTDLPPAIRPPRLWTRRSRAARATRHATWLELFFDLVFVAIVGELAHTLVEEVSWASVLGFAALFVPVWWSWIGATFFANRFDTDDAIFRLLGGVQMLILIGMAVNVHAGLGETAVPFALSYVGVRAVLVLQYLSAWIAEPAARPLTSRYCVGFGLAAALWLVSVVLPPPWRFAFWIVGFVVEFATPLLNRSTQALVPPHPEHLTERFGLFTIIVLGESVLGVVRGVAERESWQTSTAAAGGLGFAVAFALWWIYFDNVDDTVVTRLRFASQVWIYTHLPLVMGLTALGVGVEHLVAHDPGSPLADAERWLLCGAVALSLAAVGVVHLMTGPANDAQQREIRAPFHLGGAGAALALGAFGAGLRPLPLAAALAAVGLAQIVVDVVAGDERADAAPDGPRQPPPDRA